MYCSKCDQIVDQNSIEKMDGAYFCTICGYSLYESKEDYKTSKKNKKSKKHSNRGITVLSYFIALIIWTPIFVLYLVYVHPGGSRTEARGLSDLPFWQQMLAMALIFGTAYGIRSLFKKRKLKKESSSQ